MKVPSVVPYVSTRVAVAKIAEVVGSRMILVGEGLTEGIDEAEPVDRNVIEDGCWIVPMDTIIATVSCGIIADVTNGIAFLLEESPRTAISELLDNA